MPSLFACFGCGGSATVVPEPPPDIQLSREQLKAMYEESLKLNNGRLIVHGIFARADTKNNNRRVYPMNVLKREAARFEAERIQNGTAFGEVDHPSYNSCYFRSLNLANISHQVLEVWWRGDQLLGVIEILPTPSGLLLWELYSQGIKLGVSSRGWASLRSDSRTETLIVDEDFDLITFDFVTDPSTQDAYLVPIQKQYKAKVPNQIKAVLTAHLGHGTCLIERIAKMPDPSKLARHIRQLQAEYFGVGGGPKPATAEPPNKVPLPELDPSSREYFDRLLRHSHYMVYNEAAYLEKEKCARDYLHHLSDFATKAHLWDQCQPLCKKKRDQIFSNAKNAGCVLDREAMLLCQSPPIGGLQPQSCGEASTLMPASSHVGLSSLRSTDQVHAMRKLSGEIKAEVSKIKKTLANYAAKCNERQESLRTSVFAAGSLA
ncbi:hypothetical protein CEUSTIGMA_g3178.t1 [Chlamydomonas eustigma]|uniref:Uncharacterized protein n=1 Tax=Chlamydomonas eustigma TaxID=1157962 RepID=A0A250WY72_9CHLO|nr:hypothetical protein CEUSTIGMA_g3178.t1 [Chlamydomonas eustigma]|eukprot:GAX75735.1 hypothetical protein CEUSTIGMA_g3178.t1 [Chlamydomonas eustigma]